jgi:two-component system OmpR family sensor kinase
MRKSIRGRLQLWYAAVLLVVVAGFAGLLFYRVREARLRDVDSRLETAILYLDVNLRRLPPPPGDGPPGNRRPPPPRQQGEEEEYERPAPPPGLRPPERRERPGPPPPNSDRVLCELTLPPSEESLGELFYAIWRADGTLLKDSGPSADLLSPALAELAPPLHPYFVQHRDTRVAILLGPRTTRILVGKALHKEQADLRAFAWQLAGIGLAVLALGLAGGWVVSARILRPVAAISATASAISAADLSRRIDTEEVDRELGELAGVLNAMFDRLEAAFLRQARFTADASHELRTPLAIIRTNAELALSRPRSAEEYKEAVQTCLRASNRMSKLVEGLLTLARADAGKLELRRHPFDLRPIVADSVALLRTLTEAKQLSVTTQLESVLVKGDEVRLGMVVTNLLSNAIQYNRAAGKIHVQLRLAGEKVVFSVADTGCGIPEEDRAHLFERFYRVDKARSRESGGYGLGLAICKSIIEAHGGTIGFDTKWQVGSTFWFCLPAVVDKDIV